MRKRTALRAFAIVLSGGVAVLGLTDARAQEAPAPTLGGYQGLAASSGLNERSGRDHVGADNRGLGQRCGEQPLARCCGGGRRCDKHQTQALEHVTSLRRVARQL